MSALPGKPAANSNPDNGSGVDKLLATSPGARLQRAREAAGLDVNSAADSLHLSPGVVKALEADDFRALPNATFVKGYLRSYARLLGISGEELVRTYESITGTNKPEPLTPIEAPRTKPKFANPMRFALLGVIVMVVVLIFWPEGEEPRVVDTPAVDDEAASESVAVEPTEEPAFEAEQPESTLPETEAPVAEIPESEIPEPDVPQSELPESEVPDAALPDPVLSEPEPEPVPEAEPQPEPAALEPALEAALEPELEPRASVDTDPVQPEPLATGPEGEIFMEFTGDCWVEIRNGNGVLIYSNLKRNGDTLNISGVPPLEAKLGNGNVVSVSYNGQPVSFRIPPHNVVRVRLGE